MNFTPANKTISELLNTKCQFKIPRFQRDYSWEKEHYQEFIDDILDNIKFDSTPLSVSDYFLGTMLFSGKFDPGETLEVIDGQQRLTTITILFSALSDRFKDIDKSLSERIFEYIMTKNDDNETVRILKTDTSHPFFANYIQDFEKKQECVTESEEEKCIKEAFDYLNHRISESEIKKYLLKQYDKSIVERLPYADILKVVRDQVLKCRIITICTTDKNESNKIFAILNSKGKRLASVDLIKNKIFEVLSKIEPADNANDKWKKIKEHLYSGNTPGELAVFIRQYWSSKYDSASEKNLYDKFLKLPRNKDTYSDLLDDLVRNSRFYSQILNPNRADYDNKKQYYGLVQSLDKLSKDFNIVQIRTILLSLFDAKEKKLLSCEGLKKIVSYLEGFHFAYNALLANRSNTVDAKYKKYSKKIRACNSKNEINTAIQELRNEIDKIYPELEEFKKAFVKLTFSKKPQQDNVKTKYVINKMKCYYDNPKKELFADDGSIEHILPESEGEFSLNIGNLILLEETLNRDADSTPYDDKRKKIYKQSSYQWVKDFISTHTTWEESDIFERANEMAEVFYKYILKA